MAKRRSKGLGDIIETITEAVGIKQVFDAIGIDCGCETRKELLNAKFPNFKNVNCLNESDYEYLKDMPHQLTHKVKTRLNQIYINTFGINLEKHGCESCWRDYVANLKKVFKSYENS